MREASRLGIFPSRQRHRPGGAAFRSDRSEGAATAFLRFPEPHKPSRSARIAIKHQGRILFVNPNDVLAVVAQGNYVLLQRESGSYCLRGSISAMAGKLACFGFVRLHRSVVVNRLWVEEIRPHLGGECLVRLKGGKEFTVSRTWRKNLGLLAELWLGNDAFPASAG
jgi:DNA-binding LytR/AlgR family response regulator